MRKSVIIKLLLYLILISFLSVDYASGENNGNVITWDKTFGGSSEDMGFSIIQSRDGGYAIVGSIWIKYASKQDIRVIKLDENGNIEWGRTFDGDENDIAYSII